MTPSPLFLEGGGEAETTRKTSRVSYCDAVGVEGTVPVIALLLLTSMMIWLCWLYSASFRTFQRPLLWYFLFTAAMYFATACQMLYKWRRETERNDKAVRTRKSPDDRSSSTAPPLVRAVLRLYNQARMRGKYYLIKFYTVEIISMIITVVNVRTIYLCSLPPWLGGLFCFIFAVEGAGRAAHIRSKNTPERRLQGLRVDTYMDIADTILPIVVLFTAYGIKLSLQEVFQILGWASFVTHRKFVSIFSEILKIRSLKRFRVMQSKTYLNATPNRKLGRTNTQLLHGATTLQAKSMPKWFRTFVFAVCLLYSTWVGLIGVALVASGSAAARACGANTDMQLIWGKHCVVQAPLCNDMFAPDCNCAVIEVRRHNMTVLPSTVDGMTALRRVEVRDGPLATLAHNFGSRAKQLAVLNFDFNKLTKLPTSMGTMSSLHTLYASFNNIASVPSGMWSLPELFDFDLSSNEIGHTFSRATLSLPNLHFLTLDNNSVVALPRSFHAINIPNLVTFGISGNNIQHLPEDIGSFKATLEEVFAARTNLTSLPSTMQDLTRLKTLDVRNNSLFSLPAWIPGLNNLMMQTGSFTVSGNPLCSNGWVSSEACPPILQRVLEGGTTGCTPQCSDYCSVLQFENYGCDYECFSAECQFDNGQCLE